MTKIDMQSILKKAQAVMNTNAKQKEVSQLVDKIMLGSFTLSTSKTGMIHTPEEAADKFISVLRQEILSHAGTNAANGDLGATAIEALSDLNFTAPKNIGGNRYQIEIYFENDLGRESLAPSSYPDGIQNIAALLNTGYSAGHVVRGVWHGEDALSLRQRSGTHFIDNAIRDFMGNYAVDYGVLDITPNEIYN